MIIWFPTAQIKLGRKKDSRKSRINVSVTTIPRLDIITHECLEWESSKNVPVPFNRFPFDVFTQQGRHIQSNTEEDSQRNLDPGLQVPSSFVSGNLTLVS